MRPKTGVLFSEHVHPRKLFCPLPTAAVFPPPTHPAPWEEVQGQSQRPVDGEVHVAGNSPSSGSSAEHVTVHRSSSWWGWELGEQDSILWHREVGGGNTHYQRNIVQKATLTCKWKIHCVRHNDNYVRVHGLQEKLIVRENVIES